MVKIDDRRIAARLSEIRQRVGGKQAQFIPHPPKEAIDIDMEGLGVESLFNPSGLLIRNGQPVFAYIRDHTNLGPASNLTQRQCKKIHFRVCRTLHDMKQKGRFERYRVTNRKDDRYYIDIRKGWHNTEERQVKLFPCQNCLAESEYHCFNYSMEKSIREKITNQFNAEEALNLLWQQFDIFKREMADARLATLRTGYPQNWSDISKKFRRSRNFTCEKCGVRLNQREAQRCLDVHHKNADKRNNRDDNLTCLCKLCHAKAHLHYHVDSNCRKIIAAARRQQHIML